MRAVQAFLDDHDTGQPVLVLQLARAIEEDIKELAVAVPRAARVSKTLRPLADVEREHIEFVVSQVKRRSDAARILGVPVSTLYRILAKYRGEPR